MMFSGDRSAIFFDFMQELIFNLLTLAIFIVIIHTAFTSQTLLDSPTVSKGLVKDYYIVIICMLIVRVLVLTMVTLSYCKMVKK